MDLCLSSMESSYHSAAIGHRNEYRLHSGFTCSLDYSTGCIFSCDLFLWRETVKYYFFVMGKMVIIYAPFLGSIGS